MCVHYINVSAGFQQETERKYAAYISAILKARRSVED